MPDAFELLTHQRRRREVVPGGTTRTTLLEQLARAPTDEPLVTMLLLELEPGAAQPPHVHPGPIFGYMLEGELEFQCHGTERVTYRAGDVFWEPGIDRPHLVAANPSRDRPTRFLALCIGVEGEPVTKPIEPLPRKRGDATP
jgi:quercetin dioxygenase-like cupin family protein